jgi:hypothetical protein
MDRFKCGHPRTVENASVRRYSKTGAWYVLCKRCVIRKANTPRKRGGTRLTYRQAETAVEMYLQLMEMRKRQIKRDKKNGTHIPTYTRDPIRDAPESVRKEYFKWQYERLPRMVLALVKSRQAKPPKSRPSLKRGSAGGPSTSSWKTSARFKRWARMMSQTED